MREPIYNEALDAYVFEDGYYVTTNEIDDPRFDWLPETYQALARAYVKNLHETEWHSAVELN